MLVCKTHDNTPRWTTGERLDNLFEARCDELHAAANTNTTAVISDDETLSFRELDERANQLARYLIDNGVGSGERVGLMFEKSVDCYVTLLAVLKINAAYVPLDGGFPNDRCSFIMSDAGVTTLLTQSKFRDKVEEFDVSVIFVDDARASANQFSTSRLSDVEKSSPVDELAYIIYTSGTTGKPKGVSIDHPSICNFVRVAAEVYGIEPEDRCYQGMTIAFDFSVEELWVPLLAGAAIVPARPGASLVGDDLADFLASREISVLCCVPTLLATIESDLPDLRVLVLSGEACPQNLVTRWHKAGRTILNAYGPTEATVTATLTELYPNKPVTIGVPLPTYTIVILEEDAAVTVADGAMGEICIAGIGLADGYLHRPDLTDEKFIPDFLHLPNNPSNRIYRTGDLGLINAEGEIEFHGRIDTQVKVRGYRIELTEIESVLMQIPGITQAVVDTHAFANETPELVAYYSVSRDGPCVDQGAMLSTLRKNLPAYMVPGYFEQLDVIPLTTSNKADRKALPAPTGIRCAANSTNYVAPETAGEEVLAEILTDVMKLDRVSIDDHFFQELGAHSMLMAQFSSAVRKKPEFASLSMMDIYLHPTIRQLAAHISTPVPEVSIDADVVPLHKPSNLSYYGCGTAQFLFILVYGVFSLWILVSGIQWSFAAMDKPMIAYARAASFMIGTFVLFTAIPIFAKWALIGRWAAETFPVWSVKYFRFWVVKTLIENAPPMAFRGTPLLNAYLRLLGAKIGKHIVLNARQLPVATDLFEVGDDTVLQKDVLATGYSVRANRLTIGSVKIGSNVYVGHASVLDLDTTMHDGSQLGHASSLQRGQEAAANTSYHGSPAVQTQTNFQQVEPMDCSTARRNMFTAAQLMGTLLVTAPVGLFSLLILYVIVRDTFGLGAAQDTGMIVTIGKLALTSLVLFAMSMLVALIHVSLVPHLLGRFIKEGETYALFGIHHYVQQMISTSSNSKFFNIVFGDSSAIVHYLSWIGWNLNKVEQTGSNFGTNQKHDNPFMCEIGSSTMVSDGLSMNNAQMSSSSFRLKATAIGDNNYLGNNIHFPANSQTGRNCLLGTKVMIPVDGEVREHVGLLGSPAFEIPRAVDRDTAIKEQMKDETRVSRIEQKNRHNAVTSIAYLTMLWTITFIALVIGYTALQLHETYGASTFAIAGAVGAAFAVGIMALCERAIFWSTPLEPKTVSIHDAYFWTHERYWKFGETPLMSLFRGTPMKNVISRMIGVRVGAKVFDDGCQFVDKGLIEIGAYANLNAGATIQGHSLEEGAFKSDYIKIGRGSTLGPASFIHYGVRIEENVYVAPDSFVMKGETLEAESTWYANPAKAVVPIAMKEEQQQSHRSLRILELQSLQVAVGRPEKNTADQDRQIDQAA